MSARRQARGLRPPGRISAEDGGTNACSRRPLRVDVHHRALVFAVTRTRACGTLVLCIVEHGRSSHATAASGSANISAPVRPTALAKPRSLTVVVAGDPVRDRLRVVGLTVLPARAAHQHREPRGRPRELDAVDLAVRA